MESFYENDWMRSMFEADMILPGLFLGPATASEASSFTTLEITHVLRVISGEAPDIPSHVCEQMWNPHLPMKSLNFLRTLILTTKGYSTTNNR